MKNFYLRTSLALACAFGLVACGGGNQNLVLYVALEGVTETGLTITNNDGAPLPVPPAVSLLNFPDRVSEDTNFNIKIATQPSNAVCTVANGQGKTGAISPNNIKITCIAIPHNVSATVTGLTATGLVVVNGPMQYTIPPGVSSFNFTLTAADGSKTGQVGDGSAYGFVILTQPTGQTCSIANGGGIMDNVDITNVAITCV
ncbi:MAG: hypothetical protein V4631_02875 [Pseudomonadota bacterium]